MLTSLPGRRSISEPDTIRDEIMTIRDMYVMRRQCFPEIDCVG